MNPLAVADPIISPLREALDVKRAEATEKWAAFDGERKRLVEAGTDLTKNAAAVTQLDDLHRAYSTVADETQDLQDRLLRAIDGKARGLPSREDKGIPGLGAEFLRKLGTGDDRAGRLSGGASAPKSRCYTSFTTFHRFREMGAAGAHFS